jgi:hypothetical protein
MTDLVGLLYRADWSRLSLTAEVSVRRDLDLDRVRYEDEIPPPTGHEWEMATDQLGTDARRSTLLIQPGRRYREQGEDVASGCDGDRSWTATRKDGGWDVEADDGAEPPLPPMLRPSWLLTGYTLEAGEPVTADGREALRVVAVPRPWLWSRRPAGMRQLDRVEMLVDVGLGILLRHEEILDGRTLSVTELTAVRLDPDAVDDDQFAPPGGWDSVPGSVPRAAPQGPGREAAKLFADLAAGGIGPLVKSWASRSFEQAPQKEPVAEMPPDPEPLPADAPAVTDQLLHLLYDSRDSGGSGFTATLHQWQDMAAVPARVPDDVRRLWFGGLGQILDAAGRADDYPAQGLPAQLRRVPAVPDRVSRAPGPRRAFRAARREHDGRRRETVLAGLRGRVARRRGRAARRGREAARRVRTARTPPVRRGRDHGRRPSRLPAPGDAGRPGLGEDVLRR